MPILSLKPSTVAIIVAAALGSVSFFAPSVAAQAEQDSSLDSMWDDQKKTNLSEAQTAKTSSRSNKNEALEELKENLGSRLQFTESNLFKESVWPGVGPFNPSEISGDYKDNQNNRLRLKTQGDNLKSVELLLTNLDKNSQGLLNMQLTLDFALESLGLKSSKISEINTFLEKNKEKLLVGEQGASEPLSTVTDGINLSVMSISRSGEKSQDTLIKVQAKISGPDKIEDSLLSTLIPQTQPDVQEVVAVVPIQAPQKAKPAKTTTAIKPTNQENKIGKPTIKAEPVKTESAKVEPGKTEQAKTGNDNFKEELGNVIRTWQAVKKEAVKSREIGELSKILSGPALNRQTLAIKWLSENKKLYEISQQTCRVEKYSLTSQNPKRYAVFAQVKEFSKYLDETTGKVQKESNDTYDVNYTIEKKGNSYTIVDYTLVTKAKPQTNR